MPRNTVRFHRVLRATPERIYRAFLDADASEKVRTTVPEGVLATAVVVGVSGLLAEWLSTMVVVVPADSDRFFGASLTVCDMFILAFHRRLGTQAFSVGRRFSRLWANPLATGSISRLARC